MKHWHFYALLAMFAIGIAGQDWGVFPGTEQGGWAFVLIAVWCIAETIRHGIEDK